MHKIDPTSVNAASTLRPAHPLKTRSKPEKPAATPTDAVVASVNDDRELYKLDRSALQSKEAPPAEQPAAKAPAAEPVAIAADGVVPLKGISVEVLAPITREAMESRELTVGFSEAALKQVEEIGGPAPISGPGVRDLRSLNWASIDNADTKDIDQLAFVEDLPEGRKRLLVAIADVAESMPKDSPLDEHSQLNTSTVYAPGNVQPMLPRELSTDWTSLNPDVDRRAMVTELIIGADGKVEKSDVFEAAVHNRAKLDYVSLSDWAEGGPMPETLKDRPDMQEQAKKQLEVGALLSQAAQERGALAFETERVYPQIEDDRVVGLVAEKKNAANEAVAQMMIATNVANSQFLSQKGFPVFQRALDPPGRWDKMRERAVEYAGELPAGKEMPSEIAVLPAEPSPAALSKFLSEYKERDPEGYPEASLGMLKLMGGSDYVVTKPGEPLRGHFGQGVAGGEAGYLHSTAPNRRYPDVITQRLLKAAVAGEPCPYSVAELESLAEGCNKQESAAKSAQRQVTKAATAHYLHSQIGTEYSAMVTGVKKKGTFVKLADLPIEGKLVQKFEGVDVGEKLTVKLKAVDLEKGYLDFENISARDEQPQGGMLMV